MIFMVLTCLCLPGVTLAAENATPRPELVLGPCTGVPDLPPEARCGTYEVWENRGARSGRKIPLRVLVLPAEGPDRLPDPFVYFEGGPGDSAVEAGSWLALDFKSLRRRRDILLVDLRGTGASAPLFCPGLQENADLQGFLDHYLPPAQVKACAERLGKVADLAQYTTDSSVDDVDEVRAALGYDKVNLYGVSGGSRAALVYLRRHPDRVRTVALASVSPTDERGPFPMARNAQRALDGLIAECAGDEGCRAAFPRLREEVAAVLRQAGQEPVTVRLSGGETGGPVPVPVPVDIRLTRNALALTLRYMLYRPPMAALLPLHVHRAAQGDWKPMAETARTAAGGISFARGYYLSVTCSEDLPFIREEEIAAAVQGSFLGDLRIRQQQAACAAWPVPPVGRSFLEPVVSGVPVLLISGERDPVTPPGNAERVARTLRNSVQVVVPDGGHSFGGIEGAECVDRLIIRLVETGTVKGLDGTCLERAKRPEFARGGAQDEGHPSGRPPESGGEVYGVASVGGSVFGLQPGQPLGSMAPPLLSVPPPVPEPVLSVDVVSVPSKRATRAFQRKARPESGSMVVRSAPVGSAAALPGRARTATRARAPVP